MMSSLDFCGVILQRLRRSRIFVKSNNYDVKSILALKQVSVLGYRGGIRHGGDADAFRIRIALSIFDINVSLMQGASQP